MIRPLLSCGEQGVTFLPSVECPGMSLVLHSFCVPGREIFKVQCCPLSIVGKPEGLHSWLAPF